MKSKVIKIIIAALVVIGIAFGGYFGYKTVFAKKATVASLQYITSTVKKTNLQINVQSTGTAYAASTKDVLPNNIGTIKDLNVKLGDTVAAGQKLFLSDSDDVKNAVTAAQNNVNEANLNLLNAQNDLAVKQKALADAETATNTQAVQGNQGNVQSNKSIDDYKLDVEKAKLSVEQNKLKVTNAKSNLDNAKENVSKMTATAPIGGVITAINFTNGDTTQQNKAIMTIVDMSSIKVKVPVDELDIEKIKLGQKTQIKFDAIKDKTYEGTVETISQIGNTQNNVTNYDVIVSIADPQGIKIGMNANVTIEVENKENALVIPAEALVESNGKKYVRIESTESSSSAPAAETTNKQENTKQSPAANQRAQGKNGQGMNNMQSARNAQTGSNTQPTVSMGKLVEIKTGLENENYIEVLEGLTEGQRIIIALPQTSTTTNNNRNNMGGFGGGMPTGGIPTGAGRRN